VKRCPNHATESQQASSTPGSRRRDARCPEQDPCERQPPRPRKSGRPRMRWWESKPASTDSSTTPSAIKKYRWPMWQKWQYGRKGLVRGCNDAAWTRRLWEPGVVQSQITCTFTGQHLTDTLGHARKHKHVPSQVQGSAWGLHVRRYSDRSNWSMQASPRGASNVLSCDSCALVAHSGVKVSGQ
jgi:hypothetical protein